MQYPSLSELKRDCTELLVDESTTVRRAAELLLTINVSQLIVRNSSNQLTGIVAESAVIRELMNPTGAEVIGRIQSRHVESARDTASLDAILPLFRSSCHVLVPVVNDQNKVTGVVHRSDVVRLLLSDLQDNDPTRADVAGELTRPNYLRRQGIRTKRHPDEQQQ